MPKYLISASYSAEGLRGLQRDKASGRRQAVTAAIEGLGGKVEGFYNALGADDAYVIADLPDNSTAAALGIAVLRISPGGPAVWAAAIIATVLLLRWPRLHPLALFATCGALFGLAGLW